ncbi:hypothetical protein TNCV_1500771 [Trichonephila clavipes]|nr:hypothetical protein TNCV_1500771 [Trichonephila clavipes]
MNSPITANEDNTKQASTASRSAFNITLYFSSCSPESAPQRSSYYRLSVSRLSNMMRKFENARFIKQAVEIYSNAGNSLTTTIFLLSPFEYSKYPVSKMIWIHHRTETIRETGKFRSLNKSARTWMTKD